MLALRQLKIPTGPLPLPLGSIGLGEKLFGDALRFAPIDSEQSAMLPVRTSAPPSSTTGVSPTKPKPSLLSRSVSERLVPASSRSSEVTRVSLRPHTPP